MKKVIGIIHVYGFIQAQILYMCVQMHIYAYILDEVVLNNNSFFPVDLFLLVTVSLSLLLSPVVKYCVCVFAFIYRPGHGHPLLNRNIWLSGHIPPLLSSHCWRKIQRQSAGNVGCCGQVQLHSWLRNSSLPLKTLLGCGMYCFWHYLHRYNSINIYMTLGLKRERHIDTGKRFDQFLYQKTGKETKTVKMAWRWQFKSW